MGLHIAEKQLCIRLCIVLYPETLGYFFILPKHFFNNQCDINNQYDILSDYV